MKIRPQLASPPPQPLNCPFTAYLGIYLNSNIPAGAKLRCYHMVRLLGSDKCCHAPTGPFFNVRANVQTAKKYYEALPFS